MCFFINNIVYGIDAVKIMERTALWYGKLLFDTENNVTQMVQFVFMMKTASEYRISRTDVRPGKLYPNQLVTISNPL